MSSRDEILDSNVGRLMRRAYSPVAPREEFRRTLEKLVRDRLELARERAAGRSSFAPAWFAVAAALALCFASVVLYERSTHRAIEGADEITAEGRVAIWNGASWRALAVDGLEVSFALDDARRIATPQGVRAIALLGDGARVELGSASEASIEGRDSSGVAIELVRGSARLVRDGALGADWTLAAHSADGGVSPKVDFASGELECSAAPQPTSLECARVRLARGRANVGRRALVVGEWFELCSQSSLETLDASSSEPDRVAVADATQNSAAPTPPHAEQLFGTVVDAGDRTPIDTFHVVLVPRLELPHPSEPRIFDFDAARGRFAIDGVPNGNYTLWIKAAGRAAFRESGLIVGAAPIEVHAALDVGRTITGRVVARDTGRPIAGATLISEGDYPAAITELGRVDLSELLAPRASSDPSGAFELANLRAGETSLRATASGFSPDWVHLDLSGDALQSLAPVVIELDVGGTIRGRVEDASSAPQRDVLVIAVPMEAAAYPLYWESPALTDANGEFAIADLPSVQCVVVKLGPKDDRTSWSVPETRYVRVVAGDSVRADFSAAARGTHFFGRVRDADGRPLAGHSLTISPADYDGTQAISTRWRSIALDSEGRFDLTDVAPGSYEVYLSVDLPMNVVQQDRVELGAGDVEHDITVARGSIRGRVRGVDESGASFPFVAIVDRRLGDRWDFMARVIGGEDGSYAAPMLVDGEYRVSAIPSDGVHAFGSSESVTIRDGAAVAGVDLRLEKSARLALHVVDLHGEPIGSASVRLMDPTGGLVQLSTAQSTDSRGHLEFSNLTAGHWTVEVTKSGLRSSHDELELRTGERSELEIVLRAE